MSVICWLTSTPRHDRCRESKPEPAVWFLNEYPSLRWFEQPHARMLAQPTRTQVPRR